MIITKEQQEAWVNTYVKEKHSTDECIGFIDGINKTLESLDKMSNFEKYESESIKFKNENEKIDGLINSIRIVKPNLSNISKIGFISGTLYTEIKRVIREYHNWSKSKK
jgi:hypothetical protein